MKENAWYDESILVGREDGVKGSKKACCEENEVEGLRQEGGKR